MGISRGRRKKISYNKYQVDDNKVESPKHLIKRGSSALLAKKCPSRQKRQEGL